MEDNQLKNCLSKNWERDKDQVVIQSRLDCAYELGFRAAYNRPQANTEADELKPEGQRTKAEEWEACYRQLFNQLNPLVAKLKIATDALQMVSSRCTPEAQLVVDKALSQIQQEKL